MVLLVDDDPGAIRLLELAFDELAVPVEILTAFDGADALDALSQRGAYADAQRPDVVVLDLDLPKRTGQEVLREMRTTERLGAVPVVVLSQNDDQAIIDECYRLGANAYLVKPDTYDELEAIVASISTFWMADGTRVPSGP